jgi:flagellar motility protein MotE (MotC chaperone)
MKALLALMFVAALAAAWPAHAQPQGRPQGRPQQQGVQPQRANDGRQEFRRERTDRREQMEHRERFSREERDKLRQDLLDANRDMKGRR